MTVGFHVDLDLLAGSLDAMERGEAELDELLTDLTRRVEALRSTWTGDAAVAQEAAQRAWESGFRSMQEGLAAMRAAGGRAHATYSDAVGTNLRMWGQVS